MTLCAPRFDAGAHFFISMHASSFFRVMAPLVAACGLAIASVAAVAPPAAPPPVLPIETLFASPEISQLRFSPNGRYLAALVPVEHRLNLVVMDLAAQSKLLVTRLTDEGIVDYLWANDDRLLFMRDEGGRENYGLYAVDRKGGPIARLAYAGERRNAAGINPRFAGLIRRDSKDPNRVLIRAHDTMWDRPDIASMDIRTGVYRVVTPNPGMVTDWVLDWNDVARFAITDEQGKHSVLYRDKAGEEWTRISTFDEDGQGWRPLAFDHDNRTVYVASDLGRDKVAVCKFDTVTRQMGEVVCSDDTYDVISTFGGDLIVSETQRTVLGVRYNAERPRTVYWDEAAARRQTVIDQAFPGMTNTQMNATADGLRFVVLSASDRDPGVYYLLDAEKKKIEQLAIAQPKIDPEQMAAMLPVTFPSRDGRMIHGYLTLPRGREAKLLPLVLHPHGGPYGPRDLWRYDREVQFYANRGLAVLQVDYRGSGGYGHEFEQAGYKQWGLAMQDDLSDGVKWAVAQGVADPKRVVIAGASYGGYAVMAGLTLTPELYCAGINYVGVTDLMLRAKNMEDRKEFSPVLYRWHQSHIGDIYKDGKRLFDTSPVNFADRIRVPLLMGYGKNDPRVPIEHGYSMERALKRAGKPYEMVIEEDEGHGFRKEEAAIAFYKRIDQFLLKNVPGVAGSEASPDSSRKAERRP